MRKIGLAGAFVLLASTGCVSSAPTGDIASHALHSASPIPGGCQERAEDNEGRIGCYLNVSHPMGRLPASVYWHIDEFQSAERAATSKTAASAVVRAHGRIFLQTINGDPGWRPNGGNRLASIGPFPAVQGADLVARFMEARTPPGMTTRPHTHSGVEAWYMLEGSQCLETPDGAKVVPAGQSTWVPEGPPMRLSSTGKEMRRSILLVLHPASKPWMSMTDWKPKGLCEGK